MEGPGKDEVVINGELVEWRIKVLMEDKATSLAYNDQGVHDPIHKLATAHIRIRKCLHDGCPSRLRCTVRWSSTHEAGPMPDGRN